MATQVSIETDTVTLALAFGSDLATFNAGVYEGTAIPVRKMTGTEYVRVVGSTAGAHIVAESWIVDRFGDLSARQVKRLIAELGLKPAFVQILPQRLPEHNCERKFPEAGQVSGCDACTLASALA